MKFILYLLSFFFKKIKNFGIIVKDSQGLKKEVECYEI